MNNIEKYVNEMLNGARQAARELATVATSRKDRALNLAADLLIKDAVAVQAANAEDCAAAQAAGISAAMIDRLRLTDKRVRDMANGLREIVALRDPVGEIIAGWVRPNGLRIEKVRVPIGVIAMIYEARPNVTTDAAGLCLKSGNAVILRGGKEAIRSNLAVHAVLARALKEEGLSPNAALMVNVPDHEVVDLLVQAEGRVDLVIPRGGEGLIRAVAAKARVPVIKHYKGVCHTYVDAEVDLELALRVCINAKAQRPAVCNAMETLLVHEAIAGEFLTRFAALLAAAKVEVRGCARARAFLPGAKVAREEDWSVEHNDLILNVRVVDSLDAAIRHITEYGSAHSDAICTTNLNHAEEFRLRVDSACVFINTSTRFSDGGEFGFGAEVGISTDKLHARGPMGLADLTSYKYVVNGNGQIRQ